jgi:hypothetical protein
LGDSVTATKDSTPTVTTLVAPIDRRDSLLRLADPVYQDDDVLLVGREYVLVIDVSGTTATVLRGQARSQAIPHPAGARVEGIRLSRSHNIFRQLAGERRMPPS